MAHYDLEEQEQLDSIKTWWKMYGNLITGVVTAAAIGVVAWQGWNWYQRGQAAQAATIYGSLEQAVAVNDGQRIKAAAGELAAKFGGTTYAPLGALMAAKASFETGDLKTAKAQLTWAADNGKNELRDVARLRLAAILLDEKAYDEALKQLDAPHAAAFDARYAELKGDVLAVQGKKAEAKAAYGIAMAKLEGKGGSADAAKKGDPYREVLQQKLDSLGVEA